uniref:Uncharacterized protein n=1 Tax=Nothobranchius pienaari TaxID=704102 RepID=A0A1A8N5R2_9TELE
MNPWRSGSGVTLKMKVERHYRWIQLGCNVPKTSQNEAQKCEASTSLHDLSTAPGHAPDEMVDGHLRDLLPDPDYSIRQLLDNMSLVDGVRHDVPVVLSWIQVWGTGGPVHGVNAFVWQNGSSHTRSSIRRNPGPTAPAYGLTLGEHSKKGHPTPLLTH